MHFVSFHKRHSHDDTGIVDPHVFILLGLLSTRTVARASPRELLPPGPKF